MKSFFYLLSLFYLFSSCDIETGQTGYKLNMKSGNKWTGFYTADYCYSKDSLSGTSECYHYELSIKDSVIFEAEGHQVFYRLKCDFKENDDTLILSSAEVLDGSFNDTEDTEFLKLVSDGKDYFFIRNKYPFKNTRQLKVSKRNF